MSYKNREIVREKLKTRFSEIKKVYEDSGCILLSTEEEYDNEKSTLRFICSCGKESKKTYTNFKFKSSMCEECSNKEFLINVAKQNNNDYNSIKMICLDNDMELISYKEKFINKDIIEYRCSCKELNTKSILYFKKNPLCNKCRQKLIAKNRYYENKKFIEDNNCKLLTTYEEYKDGYTNLQIECKCGETYYTNFIQFKHDNKRQCNKCGRRLMSAENSPFWKGGITTESEKIRKSTKYSSWRISVFKRDNYTCKKCGNNVGGNLQAHHIENFSENLDKRFDIDNGITLCNKCHDPSIIGSFHYLYGTRNNTKEQIEEYLED